jgi:acetyl-CoA C-acetyltransferase
LAEADSIRAPRGFWDYPDPCRLIAQRFGAKARTEIAEIGVLQTTLIGRAAQAIAEGREQVVLVTGAEARYRQQRARIAGVEAKLTQQPEGTAPDSTLRPETDIISQLEIQSELAMPVGQYAMLENALRASEGQSLDAHRHDVAALWARMSEVAADNPDAWNRERMSADAIRDPQSSGGANRMLAFPYTKLHNSQWNVDQAAGLIFCSAGRAEKLGIARERWVFPLAVSDSNYMLPLTERRALHRCPGFAEAGRQALRQAGCTIDDVAHLELYSCFPVAVRAQLRELGIAEDRQHTVTGGMAFGGGPLNNFVLQALVKMAQVLRDDPGSVGLVTAVSGVLTKQGVSLWIEAVEVVPRATGPATIAGHTVLFDGDTPARCVLLCDLPDGRRTLFVQHDAALAEQMTRQEFGGRRVEIGENQQLRLS